MNIEKAKRQLRVMLSGPASGYMECAPAVKALLDELDELEADKEQIKTLESRNRRLEGIIDSRKTESVSGPVVPEEITDESTEQRLMGRRWAHSFCAGWNACRAAMLQSKYRDLSQPADPQISEYEKIMLQAGNSPAVRFDNKYITTRLEVFEDTYEIIAWLERMANGCCDPDDKYSLKEAATSLRGMYADLKEFGEALKQIQGKSGPETSND